jgi:EAL domain-containing protein (putative c-di-GMP-specific phosphodiesterase class I)
MEFPVSMVKLDPIIWRYPQKNVRSKWFVKRTIQLFHDLKIQVIAIGVSNRSDLTLIRSLGISHAQGYELGKPRPAQIIPQEVRLFSPNPVWTRVISSPSRAWRSKR